MNKEPIKEILLISLTNIGDVILTFPVIDVLRQEFPDSQLSLIVGPKAMPLVAFNPEFKKVYCYEKKQSLIKQFAWVRSLGKNRFDLIVDLRNTAIPLLLPHRYRTSLLKTRCKNIHMKQKHLNRLSQVISFSSVAEKKALHFSQEDISVVEKFLEKNRINPQARKMVLVAPGAANEDKRWKCDGFAQVCSFIKRTYGYDIVFVGDRHDNEIALSIMEQLDFSCANGCGQISLPQLGFLMKKSRLVLCNDSSPMHLASYLDVPVVAVFGPSQPSLYRPWGQQSVYVKKNVVCNRCLHPKDIQYPHICIDADSEEVIHQVDTILKKNL